MNRRLDRDLLETLIYVCIGIGEQAYYTPVGESITYKTDSEIVPGKYTTDGRIREAIYFLQDEGAIRVIKEYVRPWKHFDQYVSWELEVIKDRLKEAEARLQKQYLGDLAELGKSKPVDVKRWCNFDYKTKTLTVQLNDGQPIALTFRKSQSGQTSSQALLFEVGYELWEANTSEFDRQTVIERCHKKIKGYTVSMDATSDWFKNTRANLRRTIENSRLKDLVRAFDTENARVGKYHFSIEKPPS